MKSSLPFRCFTVTFLLSLACLFFTPSRVQAQTPFDLQNIFPHIHQDSIKKTVEDLTTFKNRYAPKGNKKVAEYVVSRLQEYGVYNAAIDSFFIQKQFWWGDNVNRWMYNVKGEITGSREPDSIVIIGAHLDAINLYFDTVPPFLVFSDTATAGADDNASGVAVMIEMARIIHLFDLVPHSSISFMAYDAEEIGLLGAYYDAEKRKNNQDKVKVMLNNDMVSYQPERLEKKLVIHWYNNAVDVAETARSIFQTHTSIDAYLPDADSNQMNEASDSWAYYQNGFRSVFLIEHHFTPHYHTLMDIMSTCNYEYAEEVAMANFALLNHYAGFSMNGTGVNTPELPAETVSVYPNPVKDFVNVRFSESKQAYITLVDAFGKTCKSVSMNDYIYKMDIQELPAGLYILHIRFENGKHSNHKIIKS